MQKIHSDGDDLLVVPVALWFQKLFPAFAFVGRDQVLEDLSFLCEGLRCGLSQLGLW